MLRDTLQLLRNPEFTIAVSLTHPLYLESAVCLLHTPVCFITFGLCLLVCHTTSIHPRIV